MKCQNLEKHLPLYAGGELHSWKKILVKHHLNRCENCRHELAKVRKVQSLISDALSERPAVDSQDRFWEEVLYRLPKEEERKVLGFQKGATFHKFVPALVGISMVVILILIGERRSMFDVSTGPDEHPIPHVPVVEHVNKPGVTVMTFQTDDPRVTIVWFFEDESKL